MRIICHALVIAAVLLTCNACNKKDERVDQAERLVRNQMKDPDSAKLSDVTRNRDAVCGYINGKNSYGAYEGMQAFVVVGEEAIIDNHSLEFNKLVYNSCDATFAATWGVKDSDRIVRDLNAAFRND